VAEPSATLDAENTQEYREQSIVKIEPWRAELRPRSNRTAAKRLSGLPG
jgi:hypothetical protein